MPGVRRTVAALVAMTALVAAQPLPDPVPADPRMPNSGADMKMPVSGPGSAEVMAAEAAGITSQAAPMPIDHPIDAEAYTCGPGDVLELNFWGQQNFRLRISVDLEGRTFISKVGYVAVAGKSLAAVRTAIKAKVRGVYPGLQADVTLVAPRTFVVHVVDYVKQPGTYSSQPLERVSSVVSRAGAVPNGSRRRITVKHRAGGAVTADLVLYELTGDTAYNPYLLDGDIIDVPFATPVVKVAGAVRRPGSYELVATKDLNELWTLTGGFTATVARDLPVRLIRRNERDQDTASDAPFQGDTPTNAPLVDDETVLVRGTEEMQRTVLLLGAVVGADPIDAATTSKRLAFVEGDSALSLIDRAGGIKAPGDLRRAYISRPRAGKTPELIALDLEALLVRRDFHADKRIEMGDTIVVPPMQYGVLVEGAVVRAGLYPFNPSFGIAEYIAHAGGRTRIARSVSDVTLVDTAGSTHSYDRALRPSPGDAIVVPERDFSRAEVAQLILAGVGVILSGVAITLAATR